MGKVKGHRPLIYGPGQRFHPAKARAAEAGLGEGGRGQPG